MGRKLVEVKFHDQVLTAVMHEGEAYVAMKPICENLGLDWSSQLQRIKRDSVLNRTMVMITTVATDQIEREMAMIPVKFLNGWLFGVDESRVRAELVERLVEYKLECYEALHNYFKQKTDFVVTRALVHEDIEILRDDGVPLAEAVAKVRGIYREAEGYDVLKYLGLGRETEGYFPLESMIAKPTRGNMEWLYRILHHLHYLEPIEDGLRKRPTYTLTAAGKAHCQNPMAKMKRWLWDSNTRDKIWRVLIEADREDLVSGSE